MALERRASLHEGSSAPMLSAELVTLRLGRWDRMYLRGGYSDPFPLTAVGLVLSSSRISQHPVCSTGKSRGQGCFSRSLQLVIPVYIPLTLGLRLCHIQQDLPHATTLPACHTSYIVPDCFLGSKCPRWTLSHVADKSADMANGSTCALPLWVALCLAGAWQAQQLTLAVYPSLTLSLALTEFALQSLVPPCVLPAVGDGDCLGAVPWGHLRGCNFLWSSP